MARDARIELVITALDNASKVLSNVTKEMDDLTKKTSDSAKSASDMQSSFAKAATGLAAFSVAAATAAVALAGIGFKEAIAGAEKFELVTINIASQLTNMAAEGQGSYKEMFDKNQIYAKSFYDKLRQYDAERASSIEEMMVVYNALVTQGYQVRMQEAKALSMITDLIKQKTAGQGFEIQAFQEIRALMDGQANMHSRIAMELKERVGPAWAEILRQHEKAGTLLTYLNSLYPGIEASSEKMQQTLEAQTTTLKSQLTYIGREGLSKAYEDIVGWLARINEYLKTHAEELIVRLQKGWDSIRSTLAAIPDLITAAIDKTSQWIEKIGVLLKNPVFQFMAGAATGATLAAPAALLGGGPAALGVGALGGGLGALGFGAYSRYRELGAAEREYAEKLHKLYGGLEGGYGPSPIEESIKKGKYITIDSLKGLGDLKELREGLPEQTKGKIKNEFADAIKEGTVKGYQQAAEIVAKEMGLDPIIFKKLIQAESGWDRYAKSPKGALGLGQLRPETAAGVGVQDAFDAGQNLRGAAIYLKQQLDKFGRYDLALAAYNAGPGNVQKYGGIPPFRETQKYVWDILGTGGSRAVQGIKEGWKAEDEAAREAEKERKKAAQNRLKWTEQQLQDELRAIERVDREEQKLYLDGIRYKKKQSEEYLQMEIKVNETILSSYQDTMGGIISSSTITYQERKAAVEAYRQASIQSIDAEIEKLRTLGITEQALESYRKAQLESINEKIKKATESGAIDWEAAWKRAAENVQDAMADMIYNMATQTKTGMDMVKNIIQSALRMISNMAAQVLMKVMKDIFEVSMGRQEAGGGSIIGAIGGLLGGALSFFNIGGGGGGGASSIGSTNAFIGTEAGGYQFPNRFAEGGVSVKPMLAMVSETGPEAHVPLKGGAIPVRLNKPQGNDIQIINAWDPAMVTGLAMQAIASSEGRQIVLNIVNQDVMERGVTSRSVRR